VSILINSPFPKVARWLLESQTFHLIRCVPDGLLHVHRCDGDRFARGRPSGEGSQIRATHSPSERNSVVIKRNIFKREMQMRNTCPMSPYSLLEAFHVDLAVGSGDIVVCHISGKHLLLGS
jgi:hypothetical protein